MEKRIRASKIQIASSAPTKQLFGEKSKFSNSSPRIEHFIAQVSSRERSYAFGLGLIFCMVGVILTPILIGIPILGVGLWMVLFPASFVKYSRKK